MMPETRVRTDTRSGARIGIPVPTATNADYNQRSWGEYATAVTRAGGEAVRLELGATNAELNALAGRCDGFLLPGSPADVDPARYGAERDEATAAPDAARERVDTLLLEHAARYAKPVLGICFGLQSMNVWRGGTLVQDLAPLPVNHAAGASVAMAHMVFVTAHTRLESMLSPEEAPVGAPLSAPMAAMKGVPLVVRLGTELMRRLFVNSSHHQAVGVPGDGLKVVARSVEDGVIEALELDESRQLFHVEHSGRRQFMLGVQWHPERSYDISPLSRSLFGHLVYEARENAVALAARRANAGGGE